MVSSLYGPASWNLNPEFFSQELYLAEPQLDTVEKQLRAVVNILHLLGKAVGMDVIPHTDRFSEMALANPQHFEWLVRSQTEIAMLVIPGVSAIVLKVASPDRGEIRSVGKIPWHCAQCRSA